MICAILLWEQGSPIHPFSALFFTLFVGSSTGSQESWSEVNNVLTKFQQISLSTMLKWINYSTLNPCMDIGIQNENGLNTIYVTLLPKWMEINQMKATYILNNSIYIVIQSNSTHLFKFPYFVTSLFFPECSCINKSSNYHLFHSPILLTISILDIQ